jgi:hypothetical protein
MASRSARRSSGVLRRPIRDCSAGVLASYLDSLTGRAALAREADYNFGTGRHQASRRRNLFPGDSTADNLQFQTGGGSGLNSDTQRLTHK